MMRAAFFGLLFSLIFVKGLSGQAYYGSVDQKVQGGIAVYGYGTGLTASFDQGIFDFLSLGIGADLYLNEDDNDDRNFYLFGRSNLHLGDFLNLPLNMDIYPGATLGITGDGLGIGLYGGIRYFFNETFGVYAEFGNHGRAGISISF